MMQGVVAGHCHSEGFGWGSHPPLEGFRVRLGQGSATVWGLDPNAPQRRLYGNEREVRQESVSLSLPAGVAKGHTITPPALLSVQAPAKGNGSEDGGMQALCPPTSARSGSGTFTRQGWLPGALPTLASLKIFPYLFVALASGTKCSRTQIWPVSGGRRPGKEALAISAVKYNRPPRPAPAVLLGGAGRDPVTKDGA